MAGSRPGTPTDNPGSGRKTPTSPSSSSTSSGSAIKRRKTFARFFDWADKVHLPGRNKDGPSPSKSTGTTTPSSSSAPTAHRRPPSSLRGKGKVFTVNFIHGKKTDGGKTKYLVRWEGFGPDEDTWEPIESFIDKKPIDDYERSISGIWRIRRYLPEPRKYWASAKRNRRAIAWSILGLILVAGLGWVIANYWNSDGTGYAAPWWASSWSRSLWSKNKMMETLVFSLPSLDGS